MIYRPQTYYLFLLMAYLILSARSCSDVAELDNGNFDQRAIWIEKTMQREKPTFYELQAFEEKAMQKMLDLGEYLVILFDEDLDNEFKEQMSEQVLSLFINDQVIVDEMQLILPSQNNISIKELISLESLNSKGKFNIRTDSMHVIQRLTEINPNHYKGRMSFIQHIIKSDDMNNSEEAKSIKTADFYLMKIEKQFGSESKKVWQVFLGDIYDARIYD